MLMGKLNALVKPLDAADQEGLKCTSTIGAGSSALRVEKPRHYGSWGNL